MKRTKNLLLVLLILFSASNRIYAQAEELAQLALNIEKLAQFKQILSDLKRGYQIVSKGYGTVKDISAGNFKIHKTFLDGLYAVSPEVKKYRRVGEIVQYQLQLVKEYQAANRYFRQSDVLSPAELAYMSEVYGRLFRSSLRNIEELTMIITAGQLRMSDDERLQAIDRIHAEIQDMLMFLRSFNNQSTVLVLQRQKEKADIGTLRRLNNLK
ncbi:TerB family tellurite resistance protein [uncultured Pedobacter sp.]|uniref:TerB family tellurite resistance protein n=1 Tax=uncultured Pedobacter sp. TaxID=246139 RepID=UPI002622EE8E|nr:TerB family tellurite resistance protein [uncultured Pedobacter sp.]